MATVANLQINLQAGSDKTLYATWSFKESSPPSSGGGSSSGGSGGNIAVGATVTVNSGAKWYNGASIAPFVFDKQWIVMEVRGDRVVINKDTSGQFSIMSAIHKNNLTVVGARQNAPARAVARASEASNLDNYEVKWFYATGQGVWFEGSSGTTTYTNHTYNYPSNASKVKITVKPVSKTYESNGQQVPYWTGIPASLEYLVSELPPDKPSAPTVTIDKYTLTAKLENIADGKAESIAFEVYKDDVKFASGTSTVKTARAIYTCNVTAGGKYRVRCRAINYVGNSPVYSEWSTYSSETLAVPSIPINVQAFVESKTSVKLTWSKDDSANEYNVEYATKEAYFDASSDVKNITVETNYVIITGIETGHEWYFRVRSKNSQGASGWSNVVYKIVGTKPEPPTTWSLTTTAVIGDPVVLYWVHNTEDGSKQNEAQIELTVNGIATIKTVDTSQEEIDEEKTDKIYSYNLDLSSYPDGAEIFWRVRTRGITFEYSDWSIQRTINTYAPPVASLLLGEGDDILTSFPYSVGVTVGPLSQKSISYHISITAEYSYITEDFTGSRKVVNAGEEVYSKVFIVSSNALSFELIPDEITLENNQTYKISVIVSMNSGLTCSVSDTFLVDWGEDNYVPDASIVIDSDNLCAYISPFCMNPDEQKLFEDVILSVYRREANGSFTLIASDILNDWNVSVTDPHPALDYARYRIVARNRNTSVMGYSDLPGIPVGETGIVIQWNEEWTNFDYHEENAPEIAPYNGSMLKLPYNVDVSETYEPDVETVEYIGRQYPISYYGTQRGSTATWNTDIPKVDVETLYALRRLSNYMGDVYVREPRGTGYTAHVTVSMNINHNELIIPVTINVTRVEGGK